MNPNCHAFKNYGGRGITVCTEWDSFEPFLEWSLLNGWEDGIELDRVDNDKGYSPDNCRWTTRKENINNRRKTILIEANGRCLPRTEWEEELNLPQGIVKSWVNTRGIEYASERISEVIESGYRERDFSRNHVAKKVLCLETGNIYESIKSAAKELGLNSGNIIRAIRTSGTTGGLHFSFA